MPGLITNTAFTKTFKNTTYVYTASVLHQGTMIAFAMDTTGQIYYSVLNFNDPSLVAPQPDVAYWSTVDPARTKPIPLAFPSEIRKAGQGSFGQAAVTQVLSNKGAIDAFRSSTAQLTAVAPFCVVSDGASVFVFRKSNQAKTSTLVKGWSFGDYALLVDRYSLSGGSLLQKSEARYQRSRSKDFPASSKDCLSPQDMNGTPFYEPTLELGFVQSLDSFTVSLIPTSVVDTSYWQIFAHGISLAATVVCTAPLAACTCSNGTNGVGATLTGTSNGVMATIDGVAPVLNNVYLVIAQSAAQNNGLYVLTQAGSAAAPWVLTRSPNYNQSAQMQALTSVAVSGGTANGNTLWRQTSGSLPTVGTSAITWIRDPGAGAIDSYSIQQSQDGLFDFAGELSFACPTHGNAPPASGAGSGVGIPPGYTALQPIPGSCGQPCGLTLAGNGPYTCAKGHSSNQIGNGACVQACGLAFAQVSTARAVDSSVALGAGVYATLPGISLASNAATSFTLEFWCRRSQTALGDTFLTHGNNALSLSLNVSAGVSTFSCSVGASTVANSKSLTPDLYWHHYALVYSAGTRTLYVDGIQVGSDSVAYSGGSQSLVLSSSSVANPALYIDELRVWSIALLPSEIQTGMQARRTGNEKLLAHYYRLNEGSGTTLIDLVASSGASNGTLAGIAAAATGWSASGAPVGQTGAVRHNSFQADGFRHSRFTLQTVSGNNLLVRNLAARLYYQQESMASGYGGVSKLQKAAGHLMLAFDGGASIGLLDFAIGENGRLVAAPAILQLPALATPILQTSTALPLIASDGHYLSVSGGLPGAAMGGQSPALVDSGTGDVRLYWGAPTSPNLSALTYNTTVVRPSYLNPAQTSLSFIGTVAGTDLNDVVVSIPYAANAVCTTALGATYANGTNGVGATLTGSANGAMASIDGVAPGLNGVYLVTAQASSFQNGLYVLTQVGTTGTPFILTRLTSYSQSSQMQLLSCASISAGSQYASSAWRQISAGSPTVGTSAITWAFDPGLTALSATAVCSSPLTCAYANGTSGVGATLTGSANGAMPAVDGVMPVLNNVYLVNAQTSSFQNGLYVLTQVGDANTKFVLTRAPSYNQSSQMQALSCASVIAGAANANTLWRQTGASAPAVGSDAISWTLDPVTCTVTVTHSTQTGTWRGTWTETWTSMPTDPQRLAAILNGIPQPPDAVTGIPPVYDYTNATSTWPGADLTNGSLWVSAIVSGTTFAGGTWSNQASGATPGSNATFRAPPTANSIVINAPLQLATLPAQGAAIPASASWDLTMETWVRPTNANGQVLIGQLVPSSGQTPITGYVLALRSSANGLALAAQMIKSPDSISTVAVAAQHVVVPLQLASTIPLNQWSHVAAAFHQKAAVQLDGDSAYVDCGSDASLNLTGDLTIEAWLSVPANPVWPMGILSKGVLGDGTTLDRLTGVVTATRVPYSLYVNDNGNLTFAYSRGSGKVSVAEGPLVSAGFTGSIAVTRAVGRSQFDVSKLTLLMWDEISFNVAGVVSPVYYVFTQDYLNSDKDTSGVAGNSASLVLGRSAAVFSHAGMSGVSGTITTWTSAQGTQVKAQIPAATSYGVNTAAPATVVYAGAFNGVVSEVRIWATALPQSTIGKSNLDAPGTSTSGLVSRWRFEERSGQQSADVSPTGSSLARLMNVCTWVQSPHASLSWWTLYVNGVAQQQASVNWTANLPGGTLSLGDLQGWPVQLAEVRIWNTERGALAIADNLNRPLPRDSSMGLVLESAADLLAYYTLDSASPATWSTYPLVYDRSAGGLDSPAPTLQNALYWNGQTSAQVAQGLSLTSSFTIEFWCKRAAAGTYDYIIQQNAGQATTDQWLAIGFVGASNALYCDDMQFSFYGDDVNVSHPACTDLQWHHWAFVYDAGSKMRYVYLDGGNLINTPAAGGTYGGGGGAITLGCVSYYGVNTCATAFVQELRIWNTALSSAAIQSNWNKALTGAETGLLALWPMSNVTGTTLVDKCGAHNATLSAAVTTPLPIPPSPGTLNLSPGPLSSALYWNGQTSANVTPNIPLTGSFTIEFWCRRMVVGHDDYIIGQNTANVVRNAQGCQDTALQIGFRGSNGNASDNNMTFAFYGDDVNVANSACTDLAWHHWAFVYDVSSRMRYIYLDGISTPLNTPAAGGTYTGGSGPVTLGSVAPIFTSMLNAYVQELRIWSGALSPTAIVSNLNKALTGVETGTTITGTQASLLALWPMMNIPGSTLPDLCGTYPATLSAPISLMPTPAQGALYFNGQGSSSTVNIPLASSFTIEFWCKRANRGHTDVILQQNAVPNQTPAKDSVLSVGFNASDQVSFSFYSDDVNVSHAACTDLNWHHWAFVYDAATRTRYIYLDGANLINTPVAATGNYIYGSGTTILGDERVSGTIATAYVQELRIWNSALAPTTIAGNLNVALDGTQAGLVALWPMNNVSGSFLLDKCNRYNLSIVMYGTAFVAPAVSAAPIAPAPSNVPVGADIPEINNVAGALPAAFAANASVPLGVEEYGVVEVDSAGNATGVLKRGFSLIQNGNWLLTGGYKVANLGLEWMGQVQFAPQVMGYVEGAPPVPGENLTDPNADYGSASSVQFTCADQVTYSYDAQRDKGFDYSVDTSATAGFAMRAGMVLAPMGIGIEEQVGDVHVDVGVKASFSGGTSRQSGASSSFSLSQTQLSEVDLLGYWFDAKDGLGARFVPNNLGTAVVKSSTADLYALRLLSTGALVGYQMLPNPHIPPDWNIITFPINPFYIRQGCLDGRFDYQDPTTQQFTLKTDPYFPGAAATPPVDASYHRVAEAYALKSRIDREAQQLYADYVANDAVAQGCASWVDVNRISASMADYVPGAGNRPALSLGSTPPTTANRSGKTIQAATDPTQLVKRNLCNTYVWTAYGGLFSETEQSLDSFTETHGGAYQFSAMAGLSVGVRATVGPADLTFSLDALFGGHVNVTMSKAANATTGFGVDVSLSLPRDLSYNSTTLMDDPNSYLNPKLKTVTPAPGRVDAYRFMTFYLAPTANNYTEFFNRVVNPAWLRSSDRNAVALRSAQQNTRSPPCWRVLHRVTFVSRVIGSGTAPLMESSAIKLDAGSHYLLIKQLEPYVLGRFTDWPSLRTAVTSALGTCYAADFPALTQSGTVLQVAQLMASYYGVSVTNS